MVKAIVLRIGLIAISQSQLICKLTSRFQRSVSSILTTVFGMMSFSPMNPKPHYKTEYGLCFHSQIEELMSAKFFQKYKGKLSLILTSPPFPLNRKKKYGNLTGKGYIRWLSAITTALSEYLKPDGSLVVEIGNSWDEKKPTMSTLPLETLLAIKTNGAYELCQQFVWFNTAKLPSPIQWVNIERTRVKDSFTNIWWMSNGVNPKANNSGVLEEYSKSMKKLLKSGKYNFGLRPSEHKIGSDSFLKDCGGSIPSNVLVAANTISNSQYLNSCKANGIVPHPARMPDEVAKFFIKFLTSPNDLILDPFAGSNTTGHICEALKRRWIAVEAKKEYVEGSQLKFKS